MDIKEMQRRTLEIMSSITTLEGIEDLARNSVYETSTIADRLKNLPDGQQIYDNIPHILKIHGKEGISELDLSHKISRKNGGGVDVDNVILEQASVNRGRQGSNMNPIEELNAEVYQIYLGANLSINLVVNNMARGAIAGGIACLPISILENSLQYRKKEISKKKFFRNVSKDVFKSGTRSAVISSGITIAALVAPKTIAAALSITNPILGAAAIGLTVYQVGRLVKKHIKL